MDNLTSTIILQDNVVVLQNKDRLETKYFTFNRVTGKQTAEGDVKFKVTVTQAAPVEAETGEDTENGTDTDAEDTAPGTPEETENQSEEETDTEADNAEGDTDEKPDTDAENTEEADPAEETDTD